MSAVLVSIFAIILFIIIANISGENKSHTSDAIILSAEKFFQKNDILPSTIRQKTYPGCRATSTQDADLMIGQAKTKSGHDIGFLLEYKNRSIIDELIIKPAGLTTWNRRIIGESLTRGVSAKKYLSEAIINFHGTHDDDVIISGYTISPATVMQIPALVPDLILHQRIADAVTSAILNDGPYLLHILNDNIIKLAGNLKNNPPAHGDNIIRRTSNTLISYPIDSGLSSDWSSIIQEVRDIGTEGQIKMIIALEANSIARLIIQSMHSGKYHFTEV